MACASRQKKAPLRHLSDVLDHRVLEDPNHLFSRYLRDLGRQHFQPFNDFTEQRAIFQRLEQARGPDRAALVEEIWCRNLKLVTGIALVYCGRGVPIMDLVQAGNLGLLTAIRKFDWRRGFKFSSYASWWIMQSIVRTTYLETIFQPYTLNPHCHAAMFQVGQQLIDFYLVYGRLAKAAELLDFANQRLVQKGQKPLKMADVVRSLRLLNRHTVRLDKPLEEDSAGEQRLLGDILNLPQSSPDLGALALDQLRDLKQTVKAIKAVIKTMPPQQAWVIRRRSGLFSPDIPSLRTIAAQWDCSRQWMDMVEKAGYRDLEQALGLSHQEVKLIIAWYQDLAEAVALFSSGSVAPQE